MTKYALIIVDMQKAYFYNDALAKVQTELVSQINHLIVTAATYKVAVHNIVTEHKRDRSTWSLNMLDDDEGYLFENSEDVEPVDRLELSSAQKTIKTRDSAFFHTDLAEKLRASAIETLIICGVSTHSCIAQTAAEAYAENFRVILVGDAIASHDPSYHQLALDLLEQEYRQSTKTTSQVTELLARAGYENTAMR